MIWFLSLVCFCSCPKSTSISHTETASKASFIVPSPTLKGLCHYLLAWWCERVSKHLYHYVKLNYLKHKQTLMKHLLFYMCPTHMKTHQQMVVGLISWRWNCDTWGKFNLRLMGTWLILDAITIAIAIRGGPMKGPRWHRPPKWRFFFYFLFFSLCFKSS